MIGQGNPWWVAMAEARLGIVIPSAGGSQRLGQPKQLLSIAGASLIRRTVRIATSLQPEQLVVVTGAGSGDSTGLSPLSQPTRASEVATANTGTAARV